MAVLATLSATLRAAVAWTAALPQSTYDKTHALYYIIRVRLGFDEFLTAPAQSVYNVPKFVDNSAIYVTKYFPHSGLDVWQIFGLDSAICLPGQSTSLDLLDTPPLPHSSFTAPPPTFQEAFSWLFNVLLGVLRYWAWNTWLLVIHQKCYGVLLVAFFAAILLMIWVTKSSVCFLKCAWRLQQISHFAKTGKTITSARAASLVNLITAPLHAEIKSLRAELKSLRAAVIQKEILVIQHARETAVAAQRHALDMQALRTVLAWTHDRAQRHIRGMETSMNTQEQDLRCLRGQFELSQGRVAEVECELEDKISANHTIISEAEICIKEIKKHQFRIIELEETEGRLRSQLHAKEGQLQREENRISDLEDRETDLKEELEKKGTTIADLTAALADLRTRLGIRDEKIVQLEAEVADLETQIEINGDIMGDLAVEVTDLKTGMSSKDAIIAKFEKKSSEDGGTIAENTNRIDQLTARNGELEKAKDALKNEKMTKDWEYGQLLAEYNSLTTQFQEVSNNFQASERDRDAQLGQIGRLTADIAAGVSIQEGLRRDVVTANQQASQLRYHLKLKDMVINGLGNDKNDLQGQVDTLRVDVSSQAERADAAEKSKEIAEENTEIAQKLLNESQGQVAALEKEVGNKKTSNDALRKNNELLTKELERLTGIAMSGGSIRQFTAATSKFQPLSTPIPTSTRIDTDSASSSQELQLRVSTDSTYETSSTISASGSNSPPSPASDGFAESQSSVDESAINSPTACLDSPQGRKKGKNTRAKRNKAKNKTTKFGTMG